MEIILASINDAKNLSYLKKRVWESTYRGIYDDYLIDNYDYKKREEKFKSLILDENQEVYVCKENSKIIGYMVLGMPLHNPLQGYDLVINDLAIDIDYQGKGIGRKFVDIAKCKNKKLYNCCNYYNKKAQAFYEKMGGKKYKIEMDDKDKSSCQIYYVY